MNIPIIIDDARRTASRSATAPCAWRLVSEVRVLLMADAVAAALSAQATPEGYYSVEPMLSR